MKVGFVIPAYQAEASVAAVVKGLFSELGSEAQDALVLVVDDGSTDATAEVARAAGARVRDLVSAGAPRANIFSNRFSNRFLSFALGRTLSDTQCGLRRYPLPETLELGGRAEGYGYEAELILRAVRLGWEVVEVPVRVIYPPESERVSHFHSVKDPARIVYRVLHTLATAPRRRQ